jgi:hypothetical protein
MRLFLSCHPQLSVIAQLPLRATFALAPEAWAVHEIGHPQRIGRLAFPGLGSATHFVGNGSQSMTIQSLFRQNAVY